MNVSNITIQGISSIIFSVGLAATTYLGFVFVISSIGKLRNYQAFISGVLEYRVLPRTLGLSFGVVVPWVECLVGIFLVIGLYLQPIAALATLLLFSFTCAIIINLLRQRYVACNCFGLVNSESISWGVVARNSYLIVLSLLVQHLAGRGLLHQVIHFSDASPFVLSSIVMRTLSFLFIVFSLGLISPLIEYTVVNQIKQRRYQRNLDEVWT